MNSKHQQQARFIVFEGVDGAGKGVQSRRLLASMAAAGLPVQLTREPGGSEGAEAIRSLVVEGAADRWDDITELLLIYAARRSHLRDTVWPGLETGTWFICDRFADSSRAFQGIAGNLGLDTVETVHKLVVGDFKPDLVIMLDLDPAISLERAAKRGGSEDRFEQKGLYYQQQVREGFRMLAQRAPDTHVLIDASGSMDEVAAAVLTEVNRRFSMALTSAGEGA